jgi:two-component system response regulator YesN
MTGSKLENALRRLNRAEKEALRLQGNLRHRLPSLPESSLEPAVGSQGEKHVRQMLDYVQQHGHRPINLNELAQAMKLNASYLSALFSEMTGVPFHQFLKEVRLAKAKDLLRDPRNRVCEVACATGYASADAFRHAFKAQEGVSPEAWRSGQ